MRPARGDGAMQRLLRLVSSTAATLAPQAQPVELSMLAWAFATLLQAPKTLLIAIANEATQKIEYFSDKDISNTMWAFGKLEFRFDPWISAMVREVFGRLPGLRAQHVSNIAWALGNLMVKSENRVGLDCFRLLSEVATSVSGRMGDFDPQALSNIAWSITRLGMSGWGGGVFMDRLAVEVREKLGKFPSLDITNVAYALAKVGRPLPELVQAMRHESAGRLQEFSSGEVARLTWSFSQLGGLESGWLDAATRRFLERGGPRRPEEGELRPGHRRRPARGGGGLVQVVALVRGRHVGLFAQVRRAARRRAPLGPVPARLRLRSRREDGREFEYRVLAVSSSGGGLQPCGSRAEGLHRPRDHGAVDRAARRHHCGRPGHM
ncbi:unnamed protein product [Prorocentrum cordatum]|uniref:Uncharacterized protein n=1 Tax=Prorocentrum cordatum TaxID=2364126 RepID=A0ABN9SXD8_9DINO|nr:unnamed protein product [Polarella glacialis]